VRSPQHVARYSNLRVQYIDHHNPDLVLLDKSGAEIHRIDLTRLSTTRSMHKLMVLLGLSEVCQDANPACAAWSSAGECDRNPEFMTDQCRRSCKACGEGATEVDVSLCRDIGSEHDCQYWSTMGECEANPSFMRTQCPKACGFCSTASATEESKDEL